MKRDRQDRFQVRPGTSSLTPVDGAPTGERRPIERGDFVRKTHGRRDFFGTALTTEGRASRMKIRVEWHPDFATWEEPADLTVIGLADMMTSERHR